MAKCDLCGKDCAAYQMTQLLESYRVPGVVDICPTCTKWANSLKSDMLLEIAPRMRAAIAQRQDAPPPRPMAPWRRVYAALTRNPITAGQVLNRPNP